MEVLPLPMPADAHVIIIIMKLQNDETRNDSITRVSPLPLSYVDVAGQRRLLTAGEVSYTYTFLSVRARLSPTVILLKLLFGSK